MRLSYPYSRRCMKTKYSNTTNSSRSPPLHKIMKSINDHTENSINAISDKLLKMPNSFFLGHLEMEPLLDLKNGLIRFDADIRDIGINHQTEEVKNEIRRFAQRCVRGEAVLLELKIVRGCCPAHSLNHFLAELHHGGKWFRVTAKDETKIGMEEMAIWR